MSDHFITDVAQFIYLLWPVFILGALFFAFQGIHFRRKTPWLNRLKMIAARMRFDLFATWTFLVFIWMVTLFATGPNITILPEPVNGLVFFGGFALIAALELVPRLVSALLWHINLVRELSLYELKNMDPGHFEELVTTTYRGLGYKANHVGHSGDHGVDIELTTPTGEYWIVQCKRYHGSVGESIVRDLFGTMTGENASRAILATTAEITPPAHAWARGKPIELVDGPRLLGLIEEARRRREGSLLDRLARWLAGAPSIPSGLARQPVVALRQEPDLERVAERTQPVRVRHPEAAAPAAEMISARAVPAVGLAAEHGAGHTNGSAPLCPVCGVRMVHRPSRPTDRPGRVLYRCRNYPACRVVLDQ